MSVFLTEVDEGLVRRAIVWSSAPWVARLDAALVHGRGRPRMHKVRSIVALMLIAAMEARGDLLLTNAANVATRLNSHQAARLGIHPLARISKQQVSRTLTEIMRATTATVNAITGEVTEPVAPMDLSALLTQMVEGMIPASIPPSRVQAIDSTDLESWAERHSPPGSRPDTTKDALPEQAAPNKSKNRVWPGFPLAGADGRKQHTRDPEAREGYRSGKNGAPKGTFIGWDNHLLVDVTETPGEPRPLLIRGVAIVPAGSCKGTAGIAAIDAALACGVPVDHVFADRGYTYLLAENWAYKLADRGINSTLDLHSNQRGVAPGPKPGTVWVDGGLFTSALPERLRRLPGYPLNQPADEAAELAKMYDERLLYALLPQGAPDLARRKQRYRGPARRSVLRCPNYPESMRLRADRHPTTSCTPGVACGCAATIVAGPGDHFRERQELLWGTTAWRKRYGGRNKVETANSLLKTHKTRIARGSVRVLGLFKNAFLFGIIIATVNIAALMSGYDHDIGIPRPDPSVAVATDDGTPPPVEPSTQHLGDTG